MQAVILAAGQGTRLRDASPVKPLTPVAGRPLILNTLDRLRAGGATSAVIVLGYAGEQVRAVLEAADTLPLTLVDNPGWAAPNGVSLAAAAPHLEARALLCMADHLVAPALYAAMIAHDLGDDALALGIDRRLGHPWVDEDDVTRVATRAARIVGIGKQIPVYDAYDCGVFVITPVLTDTLAGLDNPGLSDGVRALAARDRAATVDISQHDWLDIDDPRALALAEAWLAE
ncbi:phosphocholine cytidylyltransferase family protein [Glacieibacterium frigidum]|uniref:Nucleotidyltransferase n=1 Tax=Glacieibacterium frigidum TaxID=2593303 RepID=A0A552UGV8_9SPHN|nr:NTP transferase domain-containing protein [Glacieibacterium frigidum]TRW17459.1 nucleotidyltransferase [Glacieibacterium frigidum]